MVAPVPVVDVQFSGSTWTDLGPWLQLDPGRGLRVSHGRTDEFAEVTPAELTVHLDNSDGRFTPGRASSPYYPNVRIRRPIRYGLLLPGGAAGKQHVEGDPSFESGTNGAGAAPFFGGPAPAITTSTAHPAHGSQGVLITWGTGGQGLATWTIRGLVAGKTYTASFRIWVPSGSPNVQLGIGGITFGTAVTTKNALADLATTFVATANSHDVQIIVSTAPGGAGTTCYADAMQVEPGPARTTFEPSPAVFSWRFTGDVYSWPLAWDSPSASLAVATVTASGMLRRLGSTAELRTAGEEDILDNGPVALWVLDEPSGATQASDSSGRGQPPLELRQIGPGDGSINFGAGTGPAVDGLSVAQFAPLSAGDGYSLYGRLNEPTGTTGAALSVVVTPHRQQSSDPTTDIPIAYLEHRAGSWLGLYTKPTGALAAGYWDASTSTLTEYAWSFAMAFDRTQVLTVVLDSPSAGQGRVSLYYGPGIAGSTTFSTSSLPRFSLVQVGGARGRGVQTFQGSMSHVAAYDFPLSAVAIQVQNYAILGSSNGFSAGTWVDKLAIFGGLSGAVQAETTAGLVPPATAAHGNDLLGPQNTAGQSPVAAMQQVARTVGAVLYESTGGGLVLQHRSYRYNQTPAITLSMATVDIDPSLVLPGDDTLMANDVTATSAGNGVAYRALNATSIADYGLYRAQLDGVWQTRELAEQAAYRRTTAYAGPQQRVPNLTLNLMTQPAVAAAVLASLAVGRRIAVSGVPSAQAPATTLDLFAEGWTETLDVDTWQITINTSPAGMSDVWIVGDPIRGVIGSTARVAW